MIFFSLSLSVSQLLTFSCKFNEDKLTVILQIYNYLTSNNDVLSTKWRKFIVK